MAGVTADRIAGVQADIADALNRTSKGSMLTDQEQDRLLGQACVEACDLLTDWLDSPGWDGMRPKGDSAIGNWIPEREDLKKFLGLTLKDSLDRVGQLDRAGQYGKSVDGSLVDQAYAAVRNTTRRYPRMKPCDLFLTASQRVMVLKQEVCELAGHLTSRARKADARRRKARAVLTRVTDVLLAVVLAMAAAGPQSIAGPSEWIHEAVKVVMIHQIAHSAQPSLRVAPPRAGPRVH
jgi:hypothetical protein